MDKVLISSPPRKKVELSTAYSQSINRAFLRQTLLTGPVITLIHISTSIIIISF